MVLSYVFQRGGRKSRPTSVASSGSTRTTNSSVVSSAILVFAFHTVSRGSTIVIVLFEQPQIRREAAVFSASFVFSCGLSCGFRMSFWKTKLCCLWTMLHWYSMANRGISPADLRVRRFCGQSPTVPRVFRGNDAMPDLQPCGHYPRGFN